MTELLGDTFHLLLWAFNSSAQAAECPVNNHKPFTSLLVIPAIGLMKLQIFFSRNAHSFPKGARGQVRNAQWSSATPLTLGPPRWLEHMAAVNCHHAVPEPPVSLLSWPLREQAEFPFGCHLLIWLSINHQQTGFKRAPRKGFPKGPD